MNAITIGRLATMLVCCLLSTTTTAQQASNFGGSFFLSIRNCTGIAFDDSCPRPFIPTGNNSPVLSDFREEITSSAAATIESDVLGLAEGEVEFGGDLFTPTIRNRIITENLSRNAATLRGTQRLTYAGSAPILVTFGGAFTYSASGQVDQNCRGIKDISDLLGLPPGNIITAFVFDQCGAITVTLEILDAETGELLSGQSLRSRNGVIASPSLLEADIELIPGRAYDVSAFVQTVTRGAGQSISSLNSFVIGLVDPDTGAVTKDIPASLPQLAGVLIPASDPNQPSLIEIDVLPGSSTNEIRVGRRGVLPVALITTPDFFAPDVDRDSLTFGPGASGVALPGGGPEDVDGDGDTDFVIHFNVQESGISCGDTEVFVSGTTTSGDIIVGGDTITPTGC